eukprot:10250526-Karenia_brevis.AAC.1
MRSLSGRQRRRIARLHQQKIIDELRHQVEVMKAIIIDQQADIDGHQTALGAMAKNEQQPPYSPQVGDSTCL